MGSDPKQVIVIRKDLNMRKGKIAAQAAHASMKVLLDMMEVREDPYFPLMFYELGVEKGSPLYQWLSGKFTKICVSVDSEEELMEIYAEAKREKFLCALIEDAGLTEFGGVKTRTCIAIGPDYSERIDRLTGHLKLL